MNYSQTIGLLLAAIVPLSLAQCRTQPSAVTPRLKTTVTASSSTAALRCALISTDDDIPSGSATAGAMYVSDADRGRELLTADVMAIAKGFLAGGLPCVHVLDSYDGAIDPKPLAKLGIRLLTPANQRAWPWPFLGPMKQPYAMAALVGFHANAGSDGFRPHTINDSIKRLFINGEEVGEVAQLIVGLSAFSVPVVLVTGDMNAVAEAKAMDPTVASIAVRWRKKDGSTGFLTSEQASAKLFAAAKKAAASAHAAYRPQQPLELRLETYSSDLMAARAPGLAAAFKAYVHSKQALLQTHPLESSLDVRVFDKSRSERAVLAWQAPNALTAFVSIAVAASQLRGEDNWQLVSEGYQAFRQGRYDAAATAYRKALQINPFDAATRCRLAAVWQKQHDFERAQPLFQYGYERMSELGDHHLKVWCAKGLAQVASANHHLVTARQAALQLLALPKVNDSHQVARDTLDRVAQAKAWRHLSKRDGLEGFYPVESLTETFFKKRRIPISAEVVPELLPRLGKLVVLQGLKVRPEKDLAAEQQHYCALPHTRVFNQRKCEAYEGRRCQTPQQCEYRAYGNCSGVFYDDELFLTAAHCVAELIGSEERRRGSQILQLQWTDAGWHANSHSIKQIHTFKRSFDNGWVIGKATVDDHLDLAAISVSPAPGVAGRLKAADTPARNAPVFILGFPRSDRRRKSARRRAGYDCVFGQLSASFGLVVDSNQRRAPLCSTTGVQDDWRLQASCPRGRGIDEQGAPTPLGLITDDPFLTNTDTINGYSGAPVFDQQGRWIGLNVTVFGADPRPSYDPKARAVHLKSRAVVQALVSAGSLKKP